MFDINQLWRIKLGNLGRGFLSQYHLRFTGRLSVRIFDAVVRQMAAPDEQNVMKSFPNVPPSALFLGMPYQKLFSGKIRLNLQWIFQNRPAFQ